MRLFHIVGDEQDRCWRSPPRSQQQLLHVAAGLRVERAEGLVHQDDLRANRERAGDGDALLHAARERVGVDLLEPGQAHRFDRGG